MLVHVRLVLRVGLADDLDHAIRLGGAREGHPIGIPEPPGTDDRHLEGLRVLGDAVCRPAGILEVVLALQCVHRVAVEPSIQHVRLHVLEGRLVALLGVKLPPWVQQESVREQPGHQARLERCGHEGELQCGGGLRGDVPGPQAPEAPRRGHDRQGNAPQEIHRGVEAIGGVVGRLAEAQVLVAAKAIVEDHGQEHHEEGLPHVGRDEEQHAEADRRVHDHG
mmetsp:Transcript_134749/g.349131  ORF Transcript_134749/g.349131 Transcript_134749/m.349131 type:complete len:222 (+) Transcript_134749:1299-1964(+)